METVTAKTTPTNSEKKEGTESQILGVLRKEPEFELYRIWKSMPMVFRFPPKDRLTKQSPPVRDFATQMGIDDPVILDLMEIKTQTQFAEQFKVSPDTLTDWNKRLEESDGMEDIRTWAKKMSKNVALALYNNAIRKGYAPEVKLWFQLVEQWEEKAKLDVKHHVATIEYETVPNRKRIEDEH